MAIEALPTGDADGGRAPRPVADGLDRLLRHLGAPAADTVVAIFNHWPEVVGDRVAAHSRPLGVRRGTLVVAVDDPAWASELRWLSSTVVERARAAFGDETLERLEVRVQPLDTPD